MNTTEPVDALETADTYPKHDEYEESGIEWLGEIPGHWKTVKLKYLTECLDNRRIPLNSEERGEMQGDIPYWGANGVVDHVDDWLFDEEIVLLGEDGAPFFERNEPVSFLVDEKVWVNNHAHILKAREGLLPEFLVHVLNTVDYGGFIGGSTRDKLTQSEMGNIWVQLPPLKEQRTIASFLDRETERIDALIEKKERLIELLDEKRTALISRVVTKGLDPDVEMQDSGVDWLGEIPAHWETANLMHLTPADRKIMYGIILPGPHHEGGVPIIKGGNVKPGELERENLNCTDPEIDAENAKSRVQADDIVYAIRGSIGEAEQVPKELEGANLTQDAARISPKDDIDGRWLLHVVRSAPFFAQLEARALGATVKGINIRDLKRASVPVPPLNEQLEIAKYLDAETSKIDALKVRIDDGIDRLKDYRTALISAAVTGQIDVREEASVAPAE